MVKENDPGRVTVERQKDGLLVIKVKQIGEYTFTADDASQLLMLQSPVSGMYHYNYDQANEFWKSQTQVHILEELLVREFCHHSKGMLNL